MGHGCPFKKSTKNAMEVEEKKNKKITTKKKKNESACEII